MVVFVHTVEGRPITYHVGKDRIFAMTKGPVELERDGQRFQLRESKEEIARYIKEAQSISI